jgi:hypothetical protein
VPFPNSQSIPTAVRVVVAVLIVVICSAFSAFVACDFVKQGHIRMGVAVGVFAGLYVLVFSRPDFHRWTAQRGVWPALLVTYGIRVTVALAAFVPQRYLMEKNFAVFPDFAIGIVSVRLGGVLTGTSWTPAFNVFVITMIDGIIQHVALALFFLLVLSRIRLYCKEDPDEHRGFEALLSDRT